MSGEGAAVLPWLLIREDGHGNRYRVGSYATRAEAQQIADRLGAHGGRPAGPDGDAAEGGRPADAEAGEVAETAGADSYLVERRDAARGARG